MARPAVINPPANCACVPGWWIFAMKTKKKFPDYFNAPVPSFGASDAKLLIVGLAPGLHGANRTARPFTGDYAGDLLYATLAKFGFQMATIKPTPMTA